MIQILGGLRSTDQFPVCSSRLLPWLSGLIVVLVLALIPLPAAAQQNILTNASEDQVANLFSSGGPYTPVLSQNSFVDGGGLFSPSNYVSPYGYTVSGCQIIQYDCYDPAGHITSTAYDLGNGLYLYAYRVQSGSCPGYVWIDGFDWDVICLLDAVHLTVPLGGNAPVSAGGVSSGAFWIGTLSPLQADFSTCYGYQSAFTWFNSSEEWGILCEEIASDAVTSATVDNATSPTALTFTFPGINATNCWETCPQKGDPPSPQGYPYAVTYETPVFGFISSVPPKIITGQYATDASGRPLPAFKMVVPTVVTMVDPDPDLLVTNSGSSGSGPSVTVTTNKDSLAAGERLVQAVAADGVADVLLKIPAGAVGQQFTLTLEGDQKMGYSSLNEDGGFADPLAGSTNFTQSVTVTAVSVNTPQGPTPMAFALYQPPKDFPRSSGEDASEASRVENVEFASPSGATPGIPPAFSITLIRPPVVLIHGLWGNPNDWNDFAPIYGVGPGAASGLFSVGTVDYSVPLGTGVVTSPDYGSSDASVLAQATGSSLGFSFNAPWVLSQIKVQIMNFRKGENPPGVPVAAVQADVVAHSMGGDIAAAAAGGGDYLLETNYDRGVIHKMITVGTPFLGSPLATDLLPTEGANSSDPNACVRGLLAKYGNPSFLSVTVGSGTAYAATFDGGVGDLEGDGTGASVSSALGALEQAPAMIPTAFIVGETSLANLSGLDCSLCHAEYIRYKCHGDPLADDLTSTGWPSLFPGGATNDSDAVVPLQSQYYGYGGSGHSPASIQPGVIHSAGLTSLDFGLPDELGHGSQAVAQAVEQLLNTPVTSQQFKPVP